MIEHFIIIGLRRRKTTVISNVRTK